MTRALQLAGPLCTLLWIAALAGSFASATQAADTGMPLSVEMRVVYVGQSTETMRQATERCNGQGLAVNLAKDDADLKKLLARLQCPGVEEPTGSVGMSPTPPRPGNGLGWRIPLAYENSDQMLTIDFKATEHSATSAIACVSALMESADRHGATAANEIDFEYEINFGETLLIAATMPQDPADINSKAFEWLMFITVKARDAK